MAQTPTARAARTLIEPMTGVDSTRFEGRFTIMPALQADRGEQLRRCLAAAEKDGDRCPWGVADNGASIVARDERTYGSGYDLWLAIVDRWLTAHGHILSGFLRFRGDDPWDQGILTADGRLILTRR